MIFAAATDENTLFVFASMADAIARCEGIDVEDGGWTFWDDAGNALQAEFSAPNHRGRFTVGGGAYRLVEAPALPTLAMCLDRIDHLDGNPRFASLPAVQAHLATASPVSEHGAT